MKVAVHKELKWVYGTDIMTITMVGRWMKQFEEERTSMNHAERTSRPSDSMTIENIRQLLDLLEEDRRMTVSELCFHLQVADCARTSVYKIVHIILGFRKLASRWVPRLLTEDHKKSRLGATLEIFQAYEREGSSLIGRIVTDDETWVHHSTPESKQQSMAWCEPGEPAPKKAKAGQSANKIMATVFWDAEGILLIKYYSKGHNVNQQTYQATLKKLSAAIRRLRPGLRDDEIFLIHNNARPHTAASVQELLRIFHWYIFGHPAYLPDLASSDFFLFPQLKREPIG